MLLLPPQMLQILQMLLPPAEPQRQTVHLRKDKTALGNRLATHHQNIKSHQFRRTNRTEAALRHAGQVVR